MTAELPPNLAEQATETSEQSDIPASATDDWQPDLVDQWGLQSFPASDPPANW